MGIYQTEAVGLAVAQQNSTMRNYMQDNSGDRESVFEQFRKTYNDRVLSDFCDRILKNVYSKYANQESDIYLKEYYETFKEDLIPLFARINEECLNDPEFSSKLIKKEEYVKKIGSSISLASISPIRRLKKEILYIPASAPDEPNIFRLVAKEEIEASEYPYHIITTDICDDGTIKTTPPLRVESSGISQPVNLEETKIEVKDDIFTTQEILKDLFEKAGIKEPENDSGKRLM